MEKEKIEQVVRQVGLFIQIVGRIELYFSISILVIMVASLFANVVMRYVFRSPLPWAEEVAVYCFIWLTFLGASVALKRRRHLVMSLLPEKKLSLRAKNAFKFFAYFCLAALLIFLVIQGSRAMSLQRAMHTIALPLRISSMYFYAVPLVVGSVSMLITTVYFILELSMTVCK